MALAVDDYGMVVDAEDGQPVMFGSGAPLSVDDYAVIINAEDGQPVALGPAVPLSVDDYVLVIPAEDGQYVAIKIGGEAVNPCDPDPEVLLRITSSQPETDLPISWCGLTWAVGDNGQQKSACPTSYIRRQDPPTGTGDSGWSALHEWKNNATGLDLQIFRGIGIFTPAFEYLITNIVGLGASTYDLALFGFPSYSLVFTRNDIATFNIPLTAPTVSNYLITDSFFGQTQIGTVVYEWSKGSGWPTV